VRPVEESRKKSPSANKPTSGGRPAGLFTWIVVSLIVVVIAAVMIIKVTSSTTVTPASSFELTTRPGSLPGHVGADLGAQHRWRHLFGRAG
jgi:hypothetical protein